MSRHDVLLAYLERASAARERAQAQEDAEDLRRLAVELGMTEADLAAADAEAEKRWVRGRGFLEHRRWEDAIRDLSEAAALRPFHVEALHALARAHLEEFRRGGMRAHRSHAERLARLCLELAPDHAASFQLLNALDTPRRPQGGWVAASVCFLFLLVLGMWQALRAPPVPPAPPAAAAAPVTPGESTVSVQLEADERAAGLELDLRASTLNVYSNSAYYRLRGLLRNTGTDEVRALTLHLVMQDAQGTIFLEKDHLVVNSLGAAVRPGDTVPINVIVSGTAALRSVALRVSKVERKPAGAYAPSTPLAASWAVARPASSDLAVSQRSLSFTGSGEQRYLAADLEFLHGGKTPLAEVKFQLQHQDAAGQVLKMDEHYVAGSLPGVLWPGELRVVHVVTKVPPEAVRYQLVFLEAHP